MYIKITDGTPKRYSTGELRRDNPQVSFPRNIPNATLAEYGVYPLTPTDRPDYDPTTQTISEGTPVEVDGVWTQQWEIRDLTPEALQARVPTRVTALQGLLAIDQAGLSAQYEAWADDPARTFAERAFISKAQNWDRDNATLNAAAAALGIDDAQLDQLFTLAATL